MTFNTLQFAQVVEAAKATAAGNSRWLAAINKAAEALADGRWIVTELHDGVMVTTDSGETYHANGRCQCKAFKNGQPCKHRALSVWRTPAFESYSGFTMRTAPVESVIAAI